MENSADPRIHGVLAAHQAAINYLLTREFERASDSREAATAWFAMALRTTAQPDHLGDSAPDAQRRVIEAALEAAYKELLDMQRAVLAALR